MLTRSSPASISDNPLIDSPFNQEDDLALGNFPINNNWILLNGVNFSTLDGADFAFLGPF